MAGLRVEGAVHAVAVLGVLVVEIEDDHANRRCRCGTPRGKGISTFGCGCALVEEHQRAGGGVAGIDREVHAAGHRCGAERERLARRGACSPRVRGLGRRRSRSIRHAFLALYLQWPDYAPAGIRRVARWSKKSRKPVSDMVSCRSSRETGQGDLAALARRPCGRRRAACAGRRWTCRPRRSCRGRPWRRPAASGRICCLRFAAPCCRRSRPQS